MTAKQHTPKFGLCIDWETSGSTWGGDSSKDYQGLSIGAVIFDTQTFDVFKTFYREIKFDPSKYKWTDEAAKIHGLTIEHLEEHGVTQEEAAIDFASFLMEVFDVQKPIMTLGHNREFDIAFTKQLLEPFDIMFKVHHVNLDTSGIGFVTMGLYKSNLLFDALGFDERGAHNSLEDALITVGVCQRIRMLMNSALGV